MNTKENKQMARWIKPNIIPLLKTFRRNVMAAKFACTQPNAGLLLKDILSDMDSDCDHLAEMGSQIQKTFDSMELEIERNQKKNISLERSVMWMRGNTSPPSQTPSEGLSSAVSTGEKAGQHLLTDSGAAKRKLFEREDDDVIDSADDEFLLTAEEPLQSSTAPPLKKQKGSAKALADREISNTPYTSPDKTELDSSE